MVKFLQSNANHCRAAMDLLAQYELEHRIGVSIVSEPYRIPEDNTWIGSLQESVAIHWNYHCMESTGVPIRRGRYSVAIKWREFSVIACYISPNVDDTEYSRFLNELNSIVLELKSRSIIIAGDFNAKDRMWGARYTNSRGEKVTRWAASRDLRLLNTLYPHMCTATR
ncbi:Reverse transcriptase [Camponotus japonicus]